MQLAQLVAQLYGKRLLPPKSEIGWRQARTGKHLHLQAMRKIELTWITSCQASLKHFRL